MCRRRSRAPIGRGLSPGRRRRSPCADWWPNLPGAGCGSTTAPSGHSSAAKASASKKTVLASEQNDPGVARKRGRWKTLQGRIDPRRLVFIDETWAILRQAQDEYGAVARVGSARSAPAGTGSLRTLEDHD